MFACSHTSSRVVRVPQTMSKSSAYASSFNTSRPMNVPSGSARITMSPVASRNPRCSAKPYPCRASLTRRARVWRTSSAVRSRELLSTTITSSTTEGMKKSSTAGRM